MKPSTSLRRSHALALAAGTVAAMACATASAQETTFTGSTAGCFNGGGCVPAATDTLNGLTYTSSTFNVTTAGGFVSIGDAPASPNLDNLAAKRDCVGCSRGLVRAS